MAKLCAENLIQNGENNAILMGAPPKLSPVLGYEEDLIIATLNHGIVN
jgi:hypothetical protein